MYRMHRSTERRHYAWWRATAIAVVALAVALINPSTDAYASNPSYVAASSPTRLIQSTGNLYWTTYNLNEFGPSSASVYRASKTSTPGSERLLYRESATGGFFYFGDLTYASVGGVWYGYFVANYTQLGISQIKRIPLAGGAAVTLATSPRPVGTRDLKTDGAFLFWADDQGLRRMPIGGGAVTTIVAGTALRSVGLDSTRVYFSDGKALKSMPKTGGQTTTYVVGSTDVTAMYLHRASANSVIYWGDASGAVKSYAIGAGTTIHQSAITGRWTTSVSFDGTRVLWTDCVNGNQCNVRKRQNGTTTVVRGSGVGSSNVQGDATAMFWGDGSVMKYVH
jgi:hypothetical protein